MEYAEDKIKDVNDIFQLDMKKKYAKLYLSNEVTKKITLVSKDKVVKEDVLMELHL